MNLIEHYVNGKKFAGRSKRSGKVFNPATGEQSAEVKLASGSDLDETVKVEPTFDKIAQKLNKIYQKI